MFTDYAWITFLFVAFYVGTGLGAAVAWLCLGLTPGKHTERRTSEGASSDSVG